MGSVGTITIAAQADVGNLVKGFGQARAVLGETKLSAKALDASLNKMQTILKAQQATVGMSADQLALYKFKMQGATQAQLEQFRAVQKATAALNRQSHAFSSLRGGITGVGNALFSVKSLAVGVFAGLAGGLAVREIGGIITAGSNLNETLSKTDAILGDSSPAIKAFAQDMANKFGLVKQETLEVATSIGGIGKKLGGLKGKALEDFTTKFSKLAADLSSQANISMAEAGKAITIGLVGGDSDVLKQNGAIILESTVKAYALAHGIATAGEAMTSEQKIMARSGLIAEGLASANGDLEHTIGGVANASKRAAGTIENLKADAGIAFQAITGKVLSGINLAVAKLAEGFAVNKDSIAAWVESAVAGGGLVDQVIDRIGAGVRTAVDLLQYGAAAWKIFQGTASISLAMTLKPLSLLGKAIESVINLIPGMSVSFGTMGTAVVEELERFGAAKIKEGMKDWGAESSTGFITKFSDEMKKGIAGAAAASANLGDSLGGLVDEGALKLGQDIDSLNEKLREQIATFGMSSQEIDLYKLKMAGASDAQLAEAKSLGEQLAGLEASKKLDTGGSKQTNAAALDFGSKEARTAILAFQGQTGNDPMRDVAKTSQEQLVAQLKGNVFLKQLVDKLGVAIGTTTQDILGF